MKSLGFSVSPNSISSKSFLFSSNSSTIRLLCVSTTGSSIIGAVSFTSSITTSLISSLAFDTEGTACSITSSIVISAVFPSSFTLTVCSFCASLLDSVLAYVFLFFVHI